MLRQLSNQRPKEATATPRAGVQNGRGGVADVSIGAQRKDTTRLDGASEGCGRAGAHMRGRRRTL